MCAFLPSAFINLLGCSRYYFDFKLSWLLLLCQCQCVITIFWAIEFQFCIFCYAQEHTHTNEHKGNDFYVVWQSNTQMAADFSIGKILQYFCLSEPKARKSTQILLPHIFMLHLATIEYTVYIFVQEDRKFRDDWRMIANHSSEPANQVPELALRFLVFNGWIGHIHAAQINSYCSKPVTINLCSDVYALN